MPVINHVTWNAGDSDGEEDDQPLRWAMHGSEDEGDVLSSSSSEPVSDYAPSSGECGDLIGQARPAMVQL